MLERYIVMNSKRCFGLNCEVTVKLNCDYYLRPMTYQPFQPDRVGHECDYYFPRRHCTEIDETND